MLLTQEYCALIEKKMIAAFMKWLAKKDPELYEILKEIMGNVKIKVNSKK